MDPSEADEGGARREFLAVWGASAQSYLTFDQMRSGLSSDARAQAYWEDVAALRKSAGFVMPYRLYTPEAARLGEEGAPAASRDVFVYPSKELIRLQGRVLRLSSPGSALARRLDGWRSSRPMVAALLEGELVGALVRDGVGLDLQRARRVLSGRAAPESDEERLLERAFDLYRDPSRLMRERFTRGSVELVVEALLDGLALGGGLGRASRLDGARGFVRFDADDVLLAVCRLMNRDDEDVLPLVAIHDAPGLIWDQAPLPRLNFTAALIVRRVCCELFGYPALAYTGYAGAYARWSAGEDLFGDALPPFSSTQGSRLCAEGFDATYYQIATAQLDLLCLGRLERSVGRFEGARGRMAARLGEDGRLNERQRALLLGLLEAGGPPFSVADHAARAGVSYTTARDDLADLVGMGLLERGFSGGAGRYRPGAAYDGLLAEALRGEEG